MIAGIPDLHTGYIGSGAVDAYAGHLTISTSSWIGCEVPFKRTDVFHQVASVPGLRAGSYLVANNHDTAGLCLQWLRDFDRLEWRSSRFGHTAYEHLATLAATVPPGSGGVLFTPWLNGERSPVDDRTLRAAFLNISMTTERAHLVRAVLEGVAFNARWLLDSVERFIKRPMPVLRILGGGAVSDLWCQIHADILDRRIERVVRPDVCKPARRRALCLDVAGQYRPRRRRCASPQSTPRSIPTPTREGHMRPCTPSTAVCTIVSTGCTRD